MKINSNPSYLKFKDLLEDLYNKYNRSDFIGDDPISIPHRFTKKDDIEIAGFFSSILAWGQRKQIIKSAGLLMDLMDNAPFDFIQNSDEADIEQLKRFYYRTFQYADLEFFIRVLKDLYIFRGGLEPLISDAYLKSHDLKNAFVLLYETFENTPHLIRSMKHVANVSKGSSAKRLNMFLRWMVRSDNRGVDFGIWKKIPSSALYIPLDVHTGRVARELKLLNRKQDDWKAVEELTDVLKKFDSADPVKYDFALFGAGAIR